MLYQLLYQLSYVYLDANIFIFVVLFILSNTSINLYKCSYICIELEISYEAFSKNDFLLIAYFLSHVQMCQWNFPYFVMVAPRKPTGETTKLWELSTSKSDERGGHVLPFYHTTQMAKETTVQNGTDWDPIFCSHSILHCVGNQSENWIPLS